MHRIFENIINGKYDRDITLGHYDKNRLRRDSLWVANNHSIAIIGVLSAPIALLFMVLVSLFLGHKIMACYIVLILFCLSLYIMSISKYDHCYFEYFESIRDINIKNGVINACCLRLLT